MTNFQTRWWFLAWALGCLLLVNACHTSRRATTKHHTESKSEAHFFERLQAQINPLETLVASMQVHITLASGADMNTRAQLKLQQHQRLQVSVQPFLGIEALRIDLTPDSIKLIDRINKRFLKSNYEELNTANGIPINFYNLQALLTNQLFVPGKPIVSKSDWKAFEWHSQNNGYLFETKEIAGLLYRFKADAEERLNEIEIKNQVQQQALFWMYDNFRFIDHRHFPMKIKGYVVEKDQPKHTITIDFSKVDVNVPVDIKFDIPPSYQKISFAEVFKLLEQT